MFSLFHNKNKTLKTQSDQVKTRVVFVTTDTEMLLEKGVTYNSVCALAKKFDEIHVFVIVTGTEKHHVSRILKNIWVYQIHAPSMAKKKHLSAKITAEELVFAGVARPDMVVALDPFESGVVALEVATHCAVPLQVHVHHNPFSETAPQSIAQAKMAHNVLKNAHSCRVGTSALEYDLKQRYAHLTDCVTLPRYHDLNQYQSTKHTAHPAIVSPALHHILMAHTPITADSHLHEVLAIALPILRSHPSTVLVVAGEGPAHALFEKKIAELGLLKQIVFVSDPYTIAEWYKLADIFIEIAITKDSEKNVLRAIAAGCPMIVTQTDMRNDLLVDAESAFILPSADVTSYKKKLSELHSHEVLRSQFKTRTKEIAAQHLHDNFDTYIHELYTTIA